MQESKIENIAVPESVMEAVNRPLANVEDMQTHLHHFLSLSDPEVLAQMPPLQWAQSLLFNATLFTVKLWCSGINPDDHPVKSELDRLSLYQNKLERFMDVNKAPLRPSTTLNYQAASRFIEHSLPDLTPEQKQSMRDISRGEVPKINYQDRGRQRKRKHEYSEEKSVKIAAKEFVEKAAHELFGNNNGGIQDRWWTFQMMMNYLCIDFPEFCVDVSIGLLTSEDKDI